jgi:ATP/ADP translocase
MAISVMTASVMTLTVMTTSQVSYGLSINLTEVIWKRMVKQAYTNKKDYQVERSLMRSLRTGLDGR